MRHSESVTFGGSGLDRAAHLRGDSEAVARLRAGGGQVLVLWRGRIPVADAGGLVWLDADHPLVADLPAPVFLGLDDGVARFAVDLPGWVPAEGAPTPVFLDQSRIRHPRLATDQGFAELRAEMTRLTAREAELAATARAIIGWHGSHGFCAACGAATEMVNAGWQRACGQCGAQHFPRTDPVVIMLVTRGNRALLGRSPGWPEGMYSCLAGFMEPGETVEAAVRREVAEETGIRTGAVRYLASQPWPFPASLMIGCAAEALSDTITLDPAELEDALWIGREELLEAMAGQHPVVRPAREGSIAHFLLSNWLADRLL